MSMYSVNDNDKRSKRKYFTSLTYGAVIFNSVYYKSPVKAAVSIGSLELYTNRVFFLSSTFIGNKEETLNKFII